MLCEPLCALYSIRCAGSMEKRPLCGCRYGVEVEFRRILSRFTVVYAVAPISVTIGYMPCRMESTDSSGRYGVLSETGQCVRKVLLSVEGFGSGYL
jgi:hypothetical protein